LSPLARIEHAVVRQFLDAVDLTKSIGPFRIEPVGDVHLALAVVDDAQRQREHRVRIDRVRVVEGAVQIECDETSLRCERHVYAGQEVGVAGPTVEVHDRPLRAIDVGTLAVARHPFCAMTALIGTTETPGFGALH
jgi:hypothetical protein